MDRIRIVGGNKLNGIIPISGAKNAALPLMIAGLLTEDTLVLDNVPRLADVAQLQRILGNHGVDIIDRKSTRLNSSHLGISYAVFCLKRSPVPRHIHSFPTRRSSDLRIVGGNKLNGIIPISGAKNAALPLMIAGLLTEDTLVLDNVPRLADVAQLQRILGNHGVDIMSAGKRPGDHEYQGQTLHISAANIIDTTAPAPAGAPAQARASCTARDTACCRIGSKPARMRWR